MQIDEAEEEEPIRPTREWYALLAGLITRALLEGYLLRGWTGTQTAEVLLGLGLHDEGSKKNKKSGSKSSFFVWKGAEQQQQQQDTEKPTEIDAQNHVWAEDMPSTEEAASILFGNGTAFQEYVIEMEKRLVEFTTVSPQYPDLSSHLDNLVNTYPLEPVQTAAFRFFEAVSQWKEAPELGNYKTRATTTSPSLSSRNHRSSNDYTSSPSIQSHSPVLHQTPTKQRVRLSPSISIASLIHPPSSPSLSQPSTDSVSFLGLSNSGISSSVLRPSSYIVPAPLDRFFATFGATSSSSERTTSSSISIGSKMKLGWTGLSLGAKRPREKEGDAWVDTERAPKKPFLKGGMFNS